MSVLTIFHISIEFWGLILCIIALMCIIADRNPHKVDKKIKLGMQVCCIVLMITDSLYMGLRGDPAEWVYYIVRVCKYLVFFSNYIYMIFMVIYLWKMMSDLDERMPRRMYGVMALSVFCIVLITISQWNGTIFYFDEVNMYHRGTYYMVIQLAVVVQIVLIFTVYIQYRNRLGRAIDYAIVLYFIMSTVTTLLVVLGTGLSLQNFAVVMATQIMFAVEFLDISARLGKSQAAYAEASFAARHDPMTGICNKEYGMSQIAEYINNMEVDDKCSLCFIDVDDFKKINDVYGHMVGDYWIKEIASLLHRMCRKDDVLCRFGGDEFMLLMKGVADEDVIKARVHQLNEQMKARSTERGQEVHVSFGACMVTGWGNSIQQAIKQADEALYEGKREGKDKGKNTCVVHALNRDKEFKETIQGLKG